MVVPDYSKSVDFLRKLHPGRKWVLTAIHPDKNYKPRTITATFDQTTEQQCLDWLGEQGQTRNVYYSLAEPKSQSVTNKMERADVRAVHFLHVDIDPRAGEPLADEQARIRSMLSGDTLPGNLPAPTVIINSGGGMQALWALEAPIIIDGKIDAAEDAKLYNLAIELALSADNCHDVTRILRLPGTVNRPDEKKRAKGRVEALAEVVSFTDAKYGIDRFTKARAVGKSSGDEMTVNIDATSTARVNLDSLPASVPDSCKVVILHGHNPVEVRRKASRSEYLLGVVCQLIRAGVDDQTIYNIITDPAYPISESVLDKGRRVESYAKRQLQRAHDLVDTDAVSRINRDYFAALEGKKVLYFREEKDNTITPMNAEAFGFEVATIKQQVTDAKGNAKDVPGLPLWRESSRRRYHGRGFVLDPSHSHGDDVYNLWKGFGVEPGPGDWSLMRRHILEVLASGDEAHADFITRWAAWKFQHPATPPRVALVFRGEEGTGKGVFCRAMVDAFGVHGQHIIDANQFTGRFNSHMRHCCLLYADEVALVGDDHEGTLKAMITEPTMPIEQKGVDIVHVDNHLGIVMSSNRDFFIPAGIGARRYAMFDVSDAHKGDTDYWTKLYAEIDNGGIAAMLHDLVTFDLGKWHPESARPDTAALDSQKASNLPPLQRCWLRCLHAGVLPCGEERFGGKVFIPSSLFIDLINERLKLRDNEQVTTNGLRDMFKKMEPFGFLKYESGRPRGWVIPPLADARKAWCDTRLMKIEWDGAKEWHAHTMSPDNAAAELDDAGRADEYMQNELPF